MKVETLSFCGFCMKILVDFPKLVEVTDEVPKRVVGTSDDWIVTYRLISYLMFDKRCLSLSCSKTKLSNTYNSTVYLYLTESWYFLRF